MCARLVLRQQAGGATCRIEMWHMRWSAVSSTPCRCGEVLCSLAASPVLLPPLSHPALAWFRFNNGRFYLLVDGDTGVVRGWVAIPRAASLPSFAALAGL